MERYGIDGTAEWRVDRVCMDDDHLQRGVAIMMSQRATED